jgi:hypothetical protein
MVTITATNAGADTVRGVSVPPLAIANVAGTRALLAPPAGCVVVIPAPPEGAAAVRVELAAVLRVRLEAAERVAELAVSLVLVEGCADGPADVAAGVLAELDVCPEPPQPASTRTATATPRWRTKRTTLRA